MKGENGMFGSFVCYSLHNLTLALHKSIRILTTFHAFRPSSSEADTHDEESVHE
jgi:hypothetical protein